MQNFYALTPHDVLNAIEMAGFIPTGEYQQLNSYENRVFSLQLENGNDIVAKFYRPGRWSKETILDEHRFLLELQQEDIEVIAPLTLKNQSTLSIYNDLHLALFPRLRARMPQELLSDDLPKIGRLLARLHNVGARQKATHRLTLNVSTFIFENLELLKTFIAPEVKDRYMTLATSLADMFRLQLNPSSFIRIHGDCHRGNILQNSCGFCFVDFDDFINGPVAQDIWMLFSSTDDQERAEELDLILSGYEDLRQFDDSQMELFEPLRALRLIHYSAWIARRWHDPSFPKLFPHFGNYLYWAEETDRLEKIVRDL